MATAQVWFHQGLAIGNNGDSPLVTEPPVGYTAHTISGTATNLEIPGNANIAVIETDTAVAYRVRPASGDPAVVLANDPIIPITANSRYIIDVSRGGNIGFITA